jgi:MoxR-like ATPase
MPDPVLDQRDVLALQRACRDVAVAEPVARYAARLTQASAPEHAAAPEVVKRAVRFGAGVRAAQALVLAAKAVALLDGRAQIAFADVQKCARPVLRHRLIRSFEGEADGVTADRIVDALLEAVPARPAPVERAVRED